MSLVIEDYIILSTILFGISAAGIFINRKKLIVLLMCIELMLLSSSTLFVAFSQFSGDLNGQIFVFFTLAVAAAEAAIGLAILVLVFRNRGSINVDEITELRG